MDDTDGLMSIGAFARKVNLAPSALRFYDDCGVLRPAYVDEATGYRHYAPHQESRAVLVRRLREAGMPLTDASVVLDGPREQARAVLEEHARRARRTAELAQTAIERILRDLPGDARRTVARLGGAELVDAASWAMRVPDLGIEADQHGARLRAGDETRELPCARETFPDYRLILDDLPDVRHRIIADRAALRSAITDGGLDGPVAMDAGEQRLVLTSGGSRTFRLAAICTGAPVGVAFDPRALVPALDAGVGPDVLLEISSPVQPVVVRSADQGGFTTLVMPVRI
ncbi:DNA-binding transcriptional MerR regulator [Nonomuraea thailandensis]|uniref:DNA-binding transcriptional MerR regulator n=1 Tax=Nonomuraea thailandensis TaxID=1188745 RepID=A0A9X2GBC6_9ACTN|nr:MerR family transcriptional regulator [Nonomuraea thailandensis]MCP2355851.1 DNA-binding transcriptional MerR regulator [Nonomuraea thailandensis]